MYIACIVVVQISIILPLLKDGNLAPPAVTGENKTESNKTDYCHSRVHLEQNEVDTGDDGHGLRSPARKDRHRGKANPRTEHD